MELHGLRAEPPLAPSPAHAGGYALGTSRGGIGIRAGIGAVELVAICGVNDDLTERARGIRHEHEATIDSFCDERWAARVSELHSLDGARRHAEQWEPLVALVRRPRRQCPEDHDRVVAELVSPALDSRMPGCSLR
jgi:hypothetical protein